MLAYFEHDVPWEDIPHDWWPLQLQYPTPS